MQAGGFKLPFIVFGGGIAILLLFQLVLVPSTGRHISINILPWSIICSGIVKLGHTGAYALATRVCGSLVQACLKSIGTKCTVVNCKSRAKKKTKKKQNIKVLKLS